MLKRVAKQKEGEEGERGEPLQKGGGMTAPQRRQHRFVRNKDDSRRGRGLFKRMESAGKREKTFRQEFSWAIGRRIGGFKKGQKASAERDQKSKGKKAPPKEKGIEQVGGAYPSSLEHGPYHAHWAIRSFTQMGL